MTLRYLLEKEFKQIFRNSFLPRLIVGLPIVAVLIYPLVANFEINNINLSVVDFDKSTYSRQLVQKAQASGYFRITETPMDYESALEGIEADRSDIILEIPENFEKSLLSEGHSPLMISANAVNGTKGGLGTAYLRQIISEYNREILLSNGGTPPAGVEVVPQFRYNPSLDYKIFMIPALMVMVLAMVCGFLPALNIVGEKENGTIEQMNVTPVTKFSLILSKLIPYWIIGYVVLTSCILVAYLVYGLAPQGSIGLLYLFVTIFVLAFSGFGLVISNYAETVSQAMFMIFFFILTLILLSGLYTPVENMPPWAQRISDVSPLKYIIQSLRMVYLKGSGFSEMTTQFFALVGFAIFFNSWAILSYRKTT